MKKNKGKKDFKNWSRRNYMSLQKEGEEENPNIVNRAKILFQQRTKGKFSSSSKDSNRKFVKREVRNPNELSKVI